MKSTVTINELKKAATRLNCELAVVQAVREVEAQGRGFDDQDRVIIRFEPHLFHRYTQGRFSVSHPHLSYPTLRRSYPRNLDHSWQLFKEAAALNANAAVMATSWGGFQILGANAVTSGCQSLGEFVRRMENSEADQLDLFVTFVINSGLADELQRKDFAGFAKGYNGVGYKGDPKTEADDYDLKLLYAYKRYSLVK